MRDLISCSAVSMLCWLMFEEWEFVGEEVVVVEVGVGVLLRLLAISSAEAETTSKAA